MDELLASPSQGYHPAINSSVLIFTPDWREALRKEILFCKNTTYSTPVDLIQDLSIHSTYILAPTSPTHCLQCEKHMLITIHTVYILCTVHLLKSSNVVSQKMTVTAIWGSRCFSQHQQHQVRQTSQTLQFYKHKTLNI